MTHSIKMPAKINIAIDVLRKRSDGYHDVKMIMHNVSLFDIISIKKNENNTVNISSSSGKIPTDKENIVYKAALKFFEKTGVSFGIDIYIEKNIPINAGLAGGSADAAGTLILLNEISKSNLSKEQLCEIGAKIGADVPYCIMGGTALAQGIGDVLSPIVPICGLDILLVKPNIGISTPWVYKNLDLKNIDSPDIDLIIQCIQEKNYEKMYKNMKNVLESVTAKKYPEIDQIKSKMLSLGAKVSLMSGSGSTVFGIFDNQENIKNSYNYFKQKYNDVFITKSFNV